MTSSHQIRLDGMEHNQIIVVGSPKKIQTGTPPTPRMEGAPGRAGGWGGVKRAL